jgi:hypothetical protein
MILVLSGEGASDLGARIPTARGPEFVPGPMAWIVDQLLEKADKLNYSILALHASGADCIHFVSEADLTAFGSRRPFFLPRGSDGVGNQFFRKQAYLLGKHTKVIANDRNTQAMAVFFRDADGTRSSPSSEWECKLNSMRSGFYAAEFATGVPMVPRPKSEAWILCGLLKHQNPAQNCTGLEDEPGNDASLNSLKRQLAAYLGHDPTAEEQAELVRNGQINPELIDLPSFAAFRDELDRAFDQIANLGDWVRTARSPA